VKYSMWPFWLKVAIGILNVVLAGVGWLGWARVEDGRRWILWGIVAYFVVFLAIYAHLRKRFCPLVTVATALEANSWMRRQITSINFRSKENDDNTAQLNSAPPAPRQLNSAQLNSNSKRERSERAASSTHRKRSASARVRHTASVISS